MMHRLRYLPGLALVATLAACGSDDSGGADPDATTEDSGQGDVGRPDVDLDLGGLEDTVEDTGGEDTGGEDTGGEDTGGEDTGGTDTGADSGGEDTGGTDTGADAGGEDTGGADVADDVATDVPRPEGCGNGVIEDGEECDDGNDNNNDACTNDCVESRCGDGILNSTIGALEIEAPVVENPNGVEGYVCDDGATCPEASCDLSDDDGFAVEHGICQSLGHNRALAVSWGGGPGASSSPMLHAYNWTCFDFVCSASDDDGVASDCNDWEMLASITCEGVVGEECDDGGDNADAPDACRTTCLLPFCGDGIVDSGEECDDANRINDDGCSNNCLLPQCGDGVVQAGEVCDDGNTDDLDGCRNDCTEPFCGDGLVSVFETEEEFSSPVVTNPLGATGRVCDDGSTCSASSCDVSGNPTAPEHGICEALGYDQALSVSWGGGAGDSDNPMPHAYNWACVDFDCTAGSNDYSGDNCSSSEMLNTIVCFGGVDEECDAGEANSLEPDAACRPDCRVPYCGDGVTDTGEECDDGNDVPDDGCSNICRFPACGDGVVQEGEECDNGDANSDTEADACRTTCLFAACGDGAVDTGEECDDNNLVPDDGCSDICREPGCRDNVVQPGEECDDGNEINDDLCSNECRLPVCGDAIVQGDEECDDGNLDETDSCLNNCRSPSCGDGIVSFFDTEVTFESPVVTNPFGAEGHVCDDGGTCQGSSCDVSDNPTAPEHGICEALGYDQALSVSYGGGAGDADPVMPHAYNWLCEAFDCGPSTNEYSSDNCGSGEMLNTIVCFGAVNEQCDEGELNSDTPDATCRTDCSFPRCGDGVTDSGEECDDGNDASTDECNPDCTFTFCGDGVAQEILGEECDDGEDNDDSTPDACRTDCLAAYCGDGIVDSSEDCDDGNRVEDDGCSNSCELPGCGDGVIQPGEECDDGNEVDTDECLTTCRAAVCGDGIRQPALGEECDDGNDSDDDTCTTDCLFGPTYVPCGDETIEGAGVFTGNTAGAGNDFDEYSSEDYAYAFTASVDGTFTASLCGGATWDTRLVAYDASETCPGTRVAMNDDACGLQSQISFDVTAGNSYVVVVEAFSGGAGEYTLTLTGP